MAGKNLTYSGKVCGSSYASLEKGSTRSVNAARLIGWIIYRGTL